MENSAFKLNAAAGSYAALLLLTEAAERCPHEGISYKAILRPLV